MRTTFKQLRLQQLDRTLDEFRAVRSIARPQKGWIRALREAMGVSASELARKMGTSRQLPLQFEKAEAEDSITLKSLRNMANALDCDLVYALVPRTESLQDLVASRLRAEATRDYQRVEHSMALEDQAAGRIHEAVEAEVRRRMSGLGQ